MVTIQQIAVEFTQVSLPRPIRVILTNKSGKDLFVREIKSSFNHLTGCMNGAFITYAPADNSFSIVALLLEKSSGNFSLTHFLRDLD